MKLKVRGYFSYDDGWYVSRGCILELQEKALYGTLGKYGHLHCEDIANRFVNEMERRFRAVEDDRTVLVMKIDHVLSAVVEFHTLFTGCSSMKVESR